MKSRYLQNKAGYLKLLLGLVLVIALQGCSPYSLFSPPDDSPMQIEFDYPSSWGKIEDNVGLGGYFKYTIDFLDPADPTVAPGVEADELGIIIITVWENNANSFSLEEVIKLKLDEPTGQFILLEDRLTEIDGCPTRWIVQRRKANFKNPNTMLVENIFIQASNDMVYWISLSIIETRRNDEFGQGFDYLIQSLRVINK